MPVSLHLSLLPLLPFTLLPFQHPPPHTHTQNLLCFRIVGKISLMTWKSFWVSFDGSINLWVRHFFIGYILTEEVFSWNANLTICCCSKQFNGAFLPLRYKPNIYDLHAPLTCQLAWRFKVILSLLIFKYEFWYFVS